MYVCVYFLPSISIDAEVNLHQGLSDQSFEWTEVQQHQMTSHGFVWPPKAVLFLAFLKHAFLQTMMMDMETVRTSLRLLGTTRRTVKQPETSETAALDQSSVPR